MRKFIFGSYVYTYWLIRQERQTLSLTVTPDLRIIVKAPLKANVGRIESFLKKKWFWLEKQLRFFRKYKRIEYAREYISGESFWYLGRQYQLLVKNSAQDKVVLTKGKLSVFTHKPVTNTEYVRSLIRGWYKERLVKIFQEEFELINVKFGYKNPPKLLIREMNKRWGSFLNKDKIILNPKLIYVSKDCIDYVIAHELCHLQYKRHNEKFFNLLVKKIPLWKKLKEKLEQYPI